MTLMVEASVLTGLRGEPDKNVSRETFLSDFAPVSYKAADFRRLLLA